MNPHILFHYERPIECSLFARSTIKGDPEKCRQTKWQNIQQAQKQKKNK